MEPIPAAAPDPNWPLTLGIIAGFLVVFPLIWCTVVWFLSHASGWQRLAQRYASGSRPVTGVRYSGLTGMVGGISYRSVLTVHFDRDGFFMEPMFLFRIGQPRLFIPWADVSARRPFAILWWRAVAMTVGEPKLGTISLPADPVDKHAPPPPLS